MTINDFGSIRTMIFSFMYLDEKCGGIEWQKVEDIREASQYVEWIMTGQSFQPLILWFNFSQTADRYSMATFSKQFNALHAFWKDEFVLEGLQLIPSLNGMKYSEFDRSLQRRIEELSAECKVITTSDAEVAAHFGKMLFA